MNLKIKKNINNNNNKNRESLPHQQARMLLKRSTFDVVVRVILMLSIYYCHCYYTHIFTTKYNRMRHINQTLQLRPFISPHHQQQPPATI